MSVRSISLAFVARGNADMNFVALSQTAQEMVGAGWLVRRDGRYEITPAGLRVLELELSNMSASSTGDERAMNILRELHAAEKGIGRQGSRLD
jgi:hypothetical protein